MKPMLLFVDDEESILQALQVVLQPKAQQWDMVFSTNGMDALDVIRNVADAGARDGTGHREFAIVVSDVQMPGMNGIDLFEVLHAVSPDTVRILLTGNTDSGCAIRAINEGKVHRYLLKSCILDGLIPELESANRHYCRIKAQREEAFAAKRAKGLFLDAMTHEIRTPLNGVMGMLQLMKETGLTAEQMEYVRDALESSRRLARLFNDVLDYARLESGQAESRDVAFGIGEVMRDVAEALAKKAAAKGLALTCTVDGRLPERVFGKQGVLRQMLWHLTDNAVKFTDAGGVSISATWLPHAGQRSCRVLFMVEDSGRGIPDERLQDIFQPFTQVEHPYVRRQDGAGLGLSIVRQLAAIMDASCLAVANGRGGTTVCFSAAFGVREPGPLFPVSGATSETGATSGPGGTGRTGGARILLAAPDGPDMRVITKTLLRQGHAVDVAADGNAALRFLSTNDYGLVLTDMRLPDMDGREMAGIIRTSPGLAAKAHVPIIGLSAASATQAAAATRAGGIDAVLEKPVTASVLLKTLERFLFTKDQASKPRCRL